MISVRVRTNLKATPSGRLLRYGAVGALSTIWIFSSVAKILSLDELQAMVRAIFPDFQQSAVIPSLALVGWELLLGVSILLPRARLWGLRLSALTTVGFIGVNIVRILGAIRVPCSCFGPLYKAEPGPMIFVDLCLLAASFLLLVSEPDHGNRSRNLLAEETNALTNSCHSVHA
jgi:hypothetical protein